MEVPFCETAALILMGLVVVNSTVTSRRAMASDGSISPLHFWGYAPQTEDTLLGHGLNRYEIFFRHRFCGGTDPRVLLRTIFLLTRGAKGVYCVTQPDLMRAIPLIKRLFPRKAFVTWTWTPREARENIQYLRKCDHVFSLTDSGLEELRALGMTGRCSLGLWGCDPGVYFLKEEHRTQIRYDLLFFGLVSRDVRIVKELAALGEFSIAATRSSISLLGGGASLSVVEASTKVELIKSVHSARVTLVPLPPNGNEPTGFTNLSESLLCGTSVVIANSSTIPEQALNLPGVHRYRAGDFDSFRNAAREAIADNKQPGRREEIQRAAAALLNGDRLHAEIRRVMNLE